MSTLVYIFILCLFITHVVANLKDGFVVIYILPDKDKYITEAGFELFSGKMDTSSEAGFVPYFSWSA